MARSVIEGGGRIAVRQERFELVPTGGVVRCALHTWCVNRSCGDGRRWAIARALKVRSARAPVAWADDALPDARVIARLARVAACRTRSSPREAKAACPTLGNRGSVRSAGWIRLNPVIPLPRVIRGPRPGHPASGRMRQASGRPRSRRRSSRGLFPRRGEGAPCPAQDPRPG